MKRSDVVRLIARNVDIERAMVLVGKHQDVFFVSVSRDCGACWLARIRSYGRDYDGLGRTGLVALRRAARKWRDAK